MDAIFIRLAMLFSPVYKRQGVDLQQLQTILKMKFLLDERRPVSFRGKNASPQSRKWPFLIFTIILGFLFCFPLIGITQPYLSHTIYFSMIMFMMSFSLISDFTHVLIDTRDNYIILPKPVNDRTFIFARVLHIILHILKLTLLLTTAGILVSLYLEGIASSIVFLLEAIITAIFAVLIVCMVNLALLKYSTPEKFKDYISHLQVGFAVFIFAGNQFLPRMFGSAILEGFNIEKAPYLWLLPSFWVSSVHEVLLHKIYTFFSLSMSVAALVLPVLALFVLVKFLAPGFNRRIASLNQSEGSESNVVVSKAPGKSTFANRISNILCTNPTENAGFRITWLLTTRFREFRLRVYPSFAYVPVYFFVTVFNGGQGGWKEKLAHLPETKSYVLLTYFTCFVLISIFQNISYSDRYKASWVYFASPMSEPGRILAGMFKAVIVKYFMPFFMLISLFSIGVWGMAVINDLLLAWATTVFYALLITLLSMKGLPFSQPVTAAKQAGKSLLSFLLLLIPAGVGIFHFYICQWELFIWIMAAVAFGLLWLAFRYFKKESWESLEFND